jgi:hypothetical protein
MLAKRAASILTLLSVLFLIAQVQVPLAGAQASGAPFAYESPVMQRLWEQKGINLPTAVGKRSTPSTSQFLTIPPMYGVSEFPAGVALGDFNGDGDQDAIVAANPPMLLLGNGDGTLQAALTIGTISASPTGVSVGDFNRDGKLDVVFAIPGGAVVYLGNGNGTFGAGTTFTSGGTNENVYANVLVADVNNDGISDLVLNTDAGVSALLGIGSGSFGAPVISSVGFVTAMGAAKFNQDNYVDLAVIGSNGLSILLGNGAGAFATHSSYSGVGSRLAIGDFNSDGFQDVALSGGQLFLGNGNGTLTASGTFPTTKGADDVIAVDVNRDGRIDLLTSNTGVECRVADFGTIGVSFGNGDGTFQPVTIYDSGNCDDQFPLATGDLNNDGAPDVVALNDNPNGLIVFINQGAGTFPAAMLDISGGSGGIAVNDFNRDGNSDLVLADGSVYLGNGQGGLTFKASASLGGVVVATGDFNGDGIPDLAAAVECAPPGCSSGGQLLIALGKGDGTFQTPTALSAGGFYAESLVVADFNGDGKLDIALVTNCTNSSCSAGGSVSIFLGIGNGTFVSQGTMALPSSSPALSIVAGDFNNDGNVDLVVGLATTVFGGTNTAAILLGKGDGDFQAPVVFDVSNSGLVDGITSMSAADFNNDGILDLAFAFGGCTGCDENLAVMYGNGDGSFSTGPFILGGAYEYSVVAADFGGTGTLTPVFTVGCGDEISCASGSVYNVSAPDIMLSFLAVGDFNNDGRPDLAGALQFDPGASVVLNIGATLAATTTTLSPAAMQTHLEFQPVTFTALVQHTGPATPTGTVQFLDGGVLVGTGTVNSSGEASLTTTGLGIGAHFVVAYYMGDTNFAPSNSLGAHITITRTNTETEVSSSVNPSELDEPVTFTARIEALFGSGETGTVTFFDGPKKIGSGKVSAGKATFTTRALAVGTHYISAMYSGDANFEGSRSMLLSQVVK